ncbi:hypothetical protein BaRGS_00002341 [Batillaria attramentaria]|uniref:Uncharacterized protein n=1 Tax=Batillaria attramentaria TaxID=370345 RepID=A0ABD0M4D3_9CAEN
MNDHEYRNNGRTLATVVAVAGWRYELELAYTTTDDHIAFSTSCRIQSLSTADKNGFIKSSSKCQTSGLIVSGIQNTSGRSTSNQPLMQHADPKYPSNDVTQCFQKVKGTLAGCSGGCFGVHPPTV